MVYIIHPDSDVWNFIVKGVDDGRTVATRPLRKHSANWQLAIRKLFPNAKLYSWLLFDSQIRREITLLKDGDSLVLCDHYELCLFRTLSSLLNPKVKMFFWIWNPVEEKDRLFYQRNFISMRGEGFVPCTFDPHDAKEYGLVLFDQFFRMNQMYSVNEREKWDFYFIGYAKNRTSVILELQEKLSAYKTYFKIVHSAKDYVSYEKSVENILNSKCLVEIVQKGQSGMTLRPLEAMAFGKKLISNNESLKGMDFYNPQNIFILGMDEIDRIPDFLEKPYIPVRKEIIQKYDINTWINHFN